MRTLPLAELIGKAGEGSISEVLRRLKSGETTAEKVQAEIRAKELPKLNQKWELFRAGNLYRAQPFGFLTWLMAKPEDISSDLVIFFEMDSLLEACGERTSVRGIENWAFYCSRLLMGWSERQSFLEEGQLRPVPSMPGGMRIAFKKKQAEFNATTRAWRWPDDRGAAYNERAMEGGRS